MEAGGTNDRPHSGFGAELDVEELQSFTTPLRRIYSEFAVLRFIRSDAMARPVIARTTGLEEIE